MIAGRAQWRPEQTASIAAPTVRREHVTCYACHGSGKSAWTYHGAAMIEACKPCDGRGMRTVERFDYPDLA
jgi:DnaJ-class molecular chaperone